MRKKPAVTKCSKCGGVGCYWCRRQGTVAECPICLNSEHELFKRKEELYVCLVCGSSFSTDGQVETKDNY